MGHEYRCIFDDLAERFLYYDNNGLEFTIFGIENDHHVIKAVLNLERDTNDPRVIKANFITCSEKYKKCSMKIWWCHQNTTDINIPPHQCQCGFGHLLYITNTSSSDGSIRLDCGRGRDAIKKPYVCHIDKALEKLGELAAEKVIKQIATNGLIRAIKAELLNDVLDFLKAHDEEFHGNIAQKLQDTFEKK